MGLEQYIRAGVSLKRQSVFLQTTPTLSGSVDLQSSYIVLGINTNIPCRFRLYDDEISRDLPAEINRTFGDLNVSTSVGLVGDFSMSAAGNYYIDPGLYGCIHNPSSNLSYYRIDGNFTPPNYPGLTIETFTLEDSSKSTSNRKTLPYITGSLNVGQLVSGSLNNFIIPTTFFFVSTSLDDSSHVVRLRIYNNSASFSNTVEVNRSFQTESTDSRLLIDAIISGSSPTYFTPKIIGANIQNVNNDLQTITELKGNNELYYILQNLGPSGPVNISASLHVFSLED